MGALADARLMVGYGRPHWTWGGVELGVLSTTQAGLGLIRARLALVVLDLAVTWRRTWSYARTTPLRRGSYTDAELEDGPGARYDSVDVWAWGLAPVPLGLIDWELEAVHTYGIGGERDVYEEYLRAVAHPGWLATARLGYQLWFAQQRGLAGPLVELTWLPERGLLQRVGGDVSWAFSPAWDLILRLTVPTTSPDELGFFNGLGGTLRARYRWASR
jgi:hypothetical protein